MCDAVYRGRPADRPHRRFLNDTGSAHRGTTMAAECEVATPWHSWGMRENIADQHLTSAEPVRDAGWEPVGDDVIAIGLDGEMSSGELAEGGRLIQAGFAVRVNGRIEVFSELIGWDELTWSEEAAAVHGISRAAIDAAPRADVVDELAYQWLLSRGGRAKRRQLVAVGFNVGGFDLPFFRDALPKTMSLISRRSIDLNAILMTFGGWAPRNQTPRSWTARKQDMKVSADTEIVRLGISGQAHDAGFDAAQAILGWEWLRSQLHAVH